MPKQKLKQRSDGRYKVKYKGIQFYGATAAEALAKRDEYKIREATQHINAGEMTLRAYAAKWIQTYKASAGDQWYDQAAGYLDDAAQALGDPLLSQITPTDIAALYNRIAERSESYITKYVSTLRSCLRSACADGYIYHNPADNVRRPHGSAGTHRALTKAEDDLILQLQEHRLGPAVMAMRFAGLRRGEALYLDVDRDVDFSRKTLTVRGAVSFPDKNQPEVSEGKTAAAQRVIPLFRPLEECLRDRHGLLCAQKDGSLMSQSSFDRAWESYKACLEEIVNGCKKGWFERRQEKRTAEGLEPVEWIPCTIRTHDFRHSFATDLYNAGVDVKTAMDWMGHDDETMILRIYAHLSDAKKREAELRMVDLLNSRLYSS